MEGGLRMQRLFICGAHSTGKTTLHRRLAERLPKFHAEAELARQVIIDMGLERPDFEPVSHPDVFERVQREILRKQADTERKLDETQQPYLCDRGLDPVVYAALYLGSDAEHRLLQEDFVQQSIQRYRESFVFVTAPHERFIDDDGFRLKPNIADLRRYTDYMVQLFDRLRIRHYVIRDVSVDDRCNFVIKCIQNSSEPQLLSKSSQNSCQIEDSENFATVPNR